MRAVQRAFAAALCLPFAAAAQFLGPAPRLDPDRPELWASTPQPKAVAIIPAIDTSSKAAVRSAYSQYYATAMPAMAWTGAVSGCNAGTISTAFKEWSITRVNFFRAMAGLPGNITLNTENSAKAQQAALVYTANSPPFRSTPYLSHNLQSTDACYTADAAQAASSSNIAIASGSPSLDDVVPRYMDDGGTGNHPVGHRRWILYPRQTNMGIGSTPSGSNWGGNALWVLTGFGSPAPTPSGTPWPPRGYVPLALFPASKRWSFSYPGANFSGANVTITANGSPLTRTIVSRTDNGYGDNTIVWEPVYTLAKNVTYAVSITGVTGTGVSSSFSYTTQSFDPADPLPAPVRMDFGGDSRSDILWRNNATGQLYGVLMNGLATTGEGSVYAVANLNWKVVATGDFNGDGRADILYRNDATGQLYALLMNGLAVQSEGFVYTVGDLNWKVVGAGDVNGDGRADIVYRNDATGQVYALLMNGLVVQSEGFVYTATTAWKIVALGDLNGDGRADIVYRNDTTGQVYGLLMNGLAVQSQGFLYTVANLNWKVIFAGDFNGDGRADILYRNEATGQTYALQMNGLAVQAEGFVYNVSDLNWIVAAVGDYNGDGRSDLLWRNTATGQVYLVQLNGFLPSGEGAVYSVASGDWAIVPR